VELQTISQVSRLYGISTRTLRYYEQIGLIAPVKKEDFAYRTYDEETVLRLRQIVFLRKLRLPLKQIQEILQSEDALVAIDILERNLADIEDEITALSTIRSVLKSFIERLNLSDNTLALLDDESLLEVVDALTISKVNLKDQKTMEDLNQANEKLDRLTDRDVRIIQLPSATVAAAHSIGDEPEEAAMQMLQEFIEKTDLAKVYPAARCFGFNHPNPGVLADGTHGYEYQITIPDDLVVPAPMEKKRIEGGLYAAYMILFDEIAGIGWNRLFYGWLEGHEVWESSMSASGENMNGLLEEHLNIFNYQTKGWLQQIDLLMPIRRR